MKNRSYVLIALQFDIRSIQAQLHQWDGSTSSCTQTYFGTWLLHVSYMAHWLSK